MNVIDLSQPVMPGMPVYPGTEAPVFVAAAAIAEQGYREQIMTLWSHTGTHLDAPAHVFTDGRFLDQLPLATFIGTAVCIDCSGLAGQEISRAHLERQTAAISGSDFVLLRTGWSRHWGTATYFDGFPVLSQAAAHYLAGAAIRGIGIDAISPDPVTAGNLPIHRILLAAGLVIVENLTNLDQVPSGMFTFSCLPLKLVDGDGSPVRAVAYRD